MLLLSIFNEIWRAHTRRGHRLGLGAVCLVAALLVSHPAAAATYQPDLVLKLASEGDDAFLGAGLFESAAAVQSKSQAAQVGKAGGYTILLKNAGDTADSFVLRGTGSGSGFVVKFLDQSGTDRTGAVTGSGYATALLAPGQSVLFTLEVTPTALPLGASYRVTVTAVSGADATKTDQVKTETVACGSTAAVTISSPPDATGSPGSVVVYPYTVTNVGNGDNAFSLSVQSAAGWQGALYADDGAGGGIAGDGVRQPGENVGTVSTGTLPPGGAYRFFLAVAVPAGANHGDRGDTAVQVAGEGAGTTDRVTTTAIAAVISISESVRNITRGGTFASTAQALPGDTLEYRLAVTNSGGAPATSVAVTSAVPDATTFVTDSLWIGTSAGGDGAACPAPTCGQAGRSGGSINAYLGEGATSGAGGSLAADKTLYVYFRVQVQ